MNTGTKTSQPDTDLDSTITSKPFPAILTFSALGTHKTQLTAGATKAGTAYTDTNTYTFHVGPVAELEVRGAGPNPAVDAGRRAYTVMAVNNGPNAAPPSG